MILPMEVMVATEVNLFDKTLLAKDSYRVFHSSCHSADLLGLCALVLFVSVSDIAV